MKYYRRELFLTLVVFSILSVRIAFALDTTLVVASGRTVIDGDITLDEAKVKALNAARIRAIEKAAGVTTTGFSLLNNNLLVSDFVRTLSRGMIVEEKILKWSGSWVGQQTGDPGFPVLKVTIQGKVANVDKTYLRRDILTAALNRKNFREGEQLIITVSTNTDIYLILASYNSGGSIVSLYPNLYSENNLIKKGQILRYPNNKDMDLVVQTFPKHNRDTEAIFVIGIPVNDITRKFAWQSVFPAGQEMNYADFFLALTRLPVDWLTEEILVYTVHEK